MIIALSGTLVYLEFGTGIPKNGGEKNYLEFVYSRPKFAATAVVSTQDTRFCSVCTNSA